jgi:hypothetical protein
MATRKAVVAGMFYPGSEKALRVQVESFLDLSQPKEEVIGIVSPHAGYIYSGSTAGAVFSKIKPAHTYIILGPNHSGLGENFSINSEGMWETPLGEVLIDDCLAKNLLANSSLLKEDSLAHVREHSIEVQLPFLQCLSSKPFMMVPICIGSNNLDNLKQLGREIASTVKDSNKNIILIASSDMTHYESQKAAYEKDQKAINAILNLDEEELMEKITTFNISMCGYGPTIVMLKAAKELGAKKGELIKYTTSGEASGDYHQVVGYAGIIIK